MHSFHEWKDAMYRYLGIVQLVLSVLCV